MFGEERKDLDDKSIFLILTHDNNEVSQLIRGSQCHVLFLQIILQCMQWISIKIVQFK